LSTAVAAGDTAKPRKALAAAGSLALAGKPLITFRKFDTLELAREAALRLGPIKEIDEGEYDPPQTP
jgi:hypothetical protein